MTFDQLTFTNTGCCGTHTWAEAVHDNGLRTEVYGGDDNNSTGPFAVTTWMGRSVWQASAELPDRAAVEARLAADAAIRL